MGAVSVIFYERFRKQPNSTEYPNQPGSGVVYQELTYTCRLWDGVSVMAPVVDLVLQKNAAPLGTTNPCALNYCKIPAFSRYYWIIDWTFVDNVWSAHLQVDPLASFREDIGYGTVFADRCADRLDYNDLDQLVETDTGLPDNMLPTISEPAIEREVLTITGIQWPLLTGTYVVGIINSDQSSIGAVSYYAMTNTHFKHIMDYLMGAGNDGYLPNQDVDRETLKAILNPFQYIATVNWFPFDISDVAGSNPLRTGLSLGWWTFPSAQYYNITNNGCINKVFTFTLMDHPYSAPLKCKYLNYDPYTTYYIQLPYFGSATLNRSEFPTGKVTLLMSFDLVSGLAQCRIYHKHPTVINPSVNDVLGHCDLVRTLSGQVATPVQVGQTTSDYGAAKVTNVTASATATANSAILTRDYSTAMVNGMANAIMGAASLGSGLMSSMLGGAGGGSAMSGLGGIAAGAAQIASAKIIRDYGGTAVRAQNSAARTSAAYTSACQKAPKVETTGNNGSTMEAMFPMEIVNSFLIPSTITNHDFSAAHVTASGDITNTLSLFQWFGYAFGRAIQINEHSGYIQGHDPRIFIESAYPAEIDAVKQYIQDGFFYL